MTIWTLIPRSPVSISLLVGNRVLTSGGLFMWWMRIRQSPQAVRRFLLWAVLTNLVSWAALIGLIRLLTHGG